MNEAKPKRRWFQFSLRTLIAFMAFVGIGCGWYVEKRHEARKQQQAVEALRRFGIRVSYDFQSNSSGRRNAPEWLATMLGVDLFQNVTLAFWNEAEKPTFVDSDLDNLPDIIRGLPQLTSLDLSGAGITDSGIKCLAGLSQLKELTLNATTITDAGLDNINAISDLERLDLEETSVSDAGLQRLRNMTSLRVLDVEFTKVTDAGIEDLKKALPKLTIYSQP